MMKDSTKKIIDELIAKFGDNEFSMDDVVGISWRTFVKYVKVNRIPHYRYSRMSLNKVVDLLNDASSAYSTYDSFDTNINTYFTVKDNTIYKVTELAPTFTIRK